MELSTPSILEMTPSPSLNQNPMFSTPQMLLQRKHSKEVTMEKLKEAILKLTNSEPNGPLSTTQNTILQQRLKQFLSSLYTTPPPDHPPYAWMIQRALKELNEEGGMSEDSISEFIKKEYDNLPWAHMTLLKHHLQKLSEDGEILMIDGGLFLLAGGDKSLNSKRKSKKKYLKRKRRWDWDIKQKKRRQKEKEKERVKHDNVEAVKEQKKLDEQQNGICEELGEMSGQQNEQSIDKEDRVLNGQQNHETGDKVLRRGVQRIRVKLKRQSDATEELLQSSIASESDAVSNTGLVPVEPSRFMMTEEIKHLKDLELQPKKLCPSGVEDTADICNLYPQETLENEQRADNLPQILAPEAPPGFEFIVVEDVAANKADISASVRLDSPKEDPVVHQSSELPGEDQAPRMERPAEDVTENKADNSASVSLDSPKEDPVVHQSSERPAEDQAPRTEQPAEDVTANKADNSASVSLDPLKEDPFVHQSSERPAEDQALRTEQPAEDATANKADISAAVSLNSPKEDAVVHQSSELPGEDQAPRMEQTAEDVTENKADNSASVSLDSPKEDPVVHQSSDRPAEDQAPRMERPAEDVTAYKADNSASVSLDSPKEELVVHQSSEQPAEDQAPRTDDCSDASKQSKESLKQQRKQLHEGGSLTNDLSAQSASILSLNQNQQQSLDTERLEKEFAKDRLKPEKQQKSRHCGQQIRRSTRNSNRVQEEGTVTPNALLLSDLQGLQHISDRGRRQEQLALESSSEPKQLSFPRKVTRSQLKGTIAQPASSPSSFALKLKEREDSPETMQQVHRNLEKREAQQLKNLSKLKGSQEIVLALCEQSSKKQQQLGERVSTPEKLNEDDELDSLLLQRPAGSEAVTIERSPQTDRAQRQMKRWSSKRPEPKPGTRTPLALATSDQAMNLTSKLRGKPPQHKEDSAELCTGTISAVEANKELCLDDPHA